MVLIVLTFVVLATLLVFLGITEGWVYAARRVAVVAAVLVAAYLLLRWSVIAFIGVGLIALILWIGSTAGWTFAAQRVGGALVVIVLVTFGTSFLLRQTPGEPCAIALGTAATVESIDECRVEQGLDENVVAQYGTWAESIVLDQDLGYALYKNKEPLEDTIKQRLPRTAWLFLYSQITALALAVPMGIWSAYQAGKAPEGAALWKLVIGGGLVAAVFVLGAFGWIAALAAVALAIGLASLAREAPTIPIRSWFLPVLVAVLAVLGSVVFSWKLTSLVFVAFMAPILFFNFLRGGREGDTTVNFTAFIMLSVPVFVVGETLRYAFAVERDWYQLSGYRPWEAGAGEHLTSIWLPALVLGIAATPVYLRLLRADMIQNLQQDYVAVAKAKGMSNTHILLRHVLRPSSVTLMTVLGLNIAQLVNGAIVVEFIYDFDGMGGYLLEAIFRQEYFAVQTIVGLVAVIFVLTNMVIDVLYTSVDPRVKATGQA